MGFIVIKFNTFSWLIMQSFLSFIRSILEFNKDF